MTENKTDKPNDTKSQSNRRIVFGSICVAAIVVAGIGLFSKSMGQNDISVEETDIHTQEKRNDKISSDDEEIAPEEKEIKTEYIKELMTERNPDADYGYLDGGEGTEFYAKYDYNKNLQDAYFVFHYMDLKQTPAYAFLYGPDGTMYDACSINAGLTGDILFEVKNPQTGQYRFVIRDENGLGDCTVDARL